MPYNKKKDTTNINNKFIADKKHQFIAKVIFQIKDLTFIVSPANESNLVTFFLLQISDIYFELKKLTTWSGDNKKKNKK